VTPIPCTWNGEAFTPLPRFMGQAHEQFTPGQVYRLTEWQDRSQRSHDHYFACVTEAWQNLPERMADRFPTPEHLRKYALIRAGYADRREIAVRSATEARRIAAFVRPFDEYALVTVEGACVAVWTARSQSMRAMGKETFQKSKDDVLSLLAQAIGTDTNTLTANAGQAA